MAIQSICLVSTFALWLLQLSGTGAVQDDLLQRLGGDFVFSPIQCHHQTRYYVRSNVTLQLPEIKSFLLPTVVAPGTWPVLNIQHLLEQALVTSLP